MAQRRRKKKRPDLIACAQDREAYEVTIIQDGKRKVKLVGRFEDVEDAAAKMLEAAEATSESR